MLEDGSSLTQLAGASNEMISPAGRAGRSGGAIIAGSRPGVSGAALGGGGVGSGEHDARSRNAIGSLFMRRIMPAIMMGLKESPMKAIRVHAFGGPDVLRLEDVPVPEAGPGQVLVRVQAVGVNPVDATIRNGAYKNVVPPYTPGSDAAGLVVAAGPGVTHLNAGDRDRKSA